MNTPKLPELSDETIDRMEQTLLTRIAEERHVPARRTRSRSRLRVWTTVGGVAAAFVAGILIAPPLMSAMSVSGVAEYASDAAYGTEVAPMPVAESANPPFDMNAADVKFGDGTVGTVASSAVPSPDREIIASANAAVRVNEIAAASEAVIAIATSLGGFVESTNIGQSYRASDIAQPVPPGGDWGWVSIRVPSGSLEEAIAKLSEVGEVRSSSLSQQDVTTTAIDLRARVDATRASVERLTELMAQTGSVSELIEAERALSERQAQLESYQQQLTHLERQVAMSSLYVELERIVPVTQADPAGFNDGLKAGWNGLIASMNALVIALGFLIPWLIVIGIAALIVWLIVRGRRRALAQSTEKTE